MEKTAVVFEKIARDYSKSRFADLAQRWLACVLSKQKL